MYDAAPLQVIAHGIVPFVTVAGPVDAPFTEGVAFVSRSAPGVTEIILDEGLPGGGAVAISDVRCIICPFANPGLVPIAFDITGPTPVASNLPQAGSSLFIVRMWNTLTGLTIDNSYMFMIMRDAQSELRVPT